jgi:hypothetical protein
VLLATPLPTSAVIWGKWWGAYRTVPLLAILPGLVATAVAIESGRWIGPPLIVGLVLAYGAAVTSLGLALATWISRVGRVVALSVGTFVAVTIGAIPVALILFEGPGSFAPGVAMASPFWGIGFFSAVISSDVGPQRLWPEMAFAALFWIVAYTAAAGVLLVATLLTFDRCLGRVSDRSSLPGVRPVARGRKKPAPAIAEEF